MKRLPILLAALIAWAVPFAASAELTKLTLVGYSVAKPVFAKVIPLFVKQYKADTGHDVAFTESYGPSGAQSRAVVGGLEATSSRPTCRRTSTCW